MGAIIGRGPSWRRRAADIREQHLLDRADRPTAALATIDRMAKVNVVLHIEKVGEWVLGGWTAKKDERLRCGKKTFGVMTRLLCVLW